MEKPDRTCLIRGKDQKPSTAWVVGAPRVATTGLRDIWEDHLGFNVRKISRNKDSAVI